MTLRIVLPKQVPTGPTRSNIKGGKLNCAVAWAPTHADDQPGLLEMKTCLGGCKWNLPRSRKEKNPFPRVMSSLIARMALILTFRMPRAIKQEQGRPRKKLSLKVTYSLPCPEGGWGYWRTNQYNMEHCILWFFLWQVLLQGMFWGEIIICFNIIY